MQRAFSLCVAKDRTKYIIIKEKENKALDREEIEEYNNERNNLKEQQNE